MARPARCKERLGVPLAERAWFATALPTLCTGWVACRRAFRCWKKPWNSGAPVPRRPLRLGLGLAATLFGLTLRRFRRPSAPHGPIAHRLEESFATGMALGDCYTAQGQVLQMLNLSLQGLNYSEVYQLKDIMAFYYAGISVTLPYTPLWRWAEYYHHKAETLFAPEQRHELDQEPPLGCNTAICSWGCPYRRRLLGQGPAAPDRGASWLGPAPIEQLEARTMGALLQVWHPAGDSRSSWTPRRECTSWPSGR